MLNCACVVCRKRKFEEDIQRMLWKIKPEELSFKTSAESVRLLLLKVSQRLCSGAVSNIQ